MTEDIIENIAGSVIQHGKHNNRIYLMKLQKERTEEVLAKIKKLRSKNGYSRIFAKVPANSSVPFIINGYNIEGYIPGYFSGKQDLLFMKKYFSKDKNVLPKDELNILHSILNKEITRPEPATFKILKMRFHHVDEMAALYNQIFVTYPFPITDRDYLKKTMEENIYYYGVLDNDRLIALSSSEADMDDKAVEMTDFAVLPEYRGRNISYYLLEKMEKDMRKMGFRTFYTIARLRAPGMNLTFLKNDYKYSGTLINNTNISGNIESMNVFYKTV